MAVRPAAQLEAQITLVATDTFEALPGLPVQLQLFDPAIGDFRPVITGTTDREGRTVLRFQAPAQPGRYRYRSGWAGNLAFRPDTSPEVRLDVEVPAA